MKRPNDIITSTEADPVNKQALKIIAGWFLLCCIPGAGPTLSSIWFVTCLVLVLKGAK